MASDPTLLAVDSADVVAQLESAVESGRPLNEVLPEFLTTVVNGTNAGAGVIWLADANNILRPAIQERWSQAGIQGDGPRVDRHRQLVTRAVEQRRILLAGPHNTELNELPLPRTFLFAPLLRQNALLGVFELVLSRQSSEVELAAVVEIVEHVQGFVELWEDESQTAFRPVGTPAFWRQAEPFLFDLQQHLDSRHLGYSASTSLRDLLAVDRVTVVGRTGRSFKVLAVSGQVKVSRHSPHVRQAKQVAREVIQADEMLLHCRQNQLAPHDMSPNVAEFLNATHAQVLAVIPLHAHPEPDAADAEPNRQPKTERSVGALIVERSKSSSFNAAHVEVLRLLADHVGNALGRTQRHESLLLLPVWRTLGRTYHWLTRNHLRKSIAALLLIAIALVSLVVVPWDYRVTGDGSLMPTVQRRVFAPSDAEVGEVHVTGGEFVEAGTPLVQLVSKELESEEIRLRTLIQEKQTSLNALRSAREASQRADDQSRTIEIEGQYAEHQVEIRHLREQHRGVKDRLQQLNVVAPCAGVVATFQVDQLLSDRPVNRGDILLEVMDPQQGWQLELKLEDRRMGPLLVAAEENGELPVEFILVTWPEVAYHGSVKSIGYRSNSMPEAGNVVDLHVDPALRTSSEEGSQDARATNALPPEALWIGASVKAKISCGPRPLGYVLFGDVIDYLRKTLWL